MSHGEMLWLMNEITDIRKIVGGRAVKINEKNYKPAATSIEDDIESLQKEVNTIKLMLENINKKLDESTVANKELSGLTETLKNATNVLEEEIKDINA